MGKKKKTRIKVGSNKPITSKEFEAKHDLTATHFSQALYCFGRAKHNKPSVETQPFILSSIIHFYFAVEAATNSIGHDIMLSEKSKFYIKEENRNIELKKFFKSWRYISLEDKFIFLKEKFSLDEISIELKEELKELNMLRNFIVHNKIYKTNYIRPDNDLGDEANEWEVEEEDPADIFKRTKFNLPAKLEVNDAYTAFRICLKLLVILVKKFKPFLLYFLPSPNGDTRTYSYVSDEKTFEVQEQEILDLLSSKKVHF